jgi:hypothetical protein
VRSVCGTFNLWGVSIGSGITGSADGLLCSLGGGQIMQALVIWVRGVANVSVLESVEL